MLFIIILEMGNELGIQQDGTAYVYLVPPNCCHEIMLWKTYHHVEIFTVPKRKKGNKGRQATKWYEVGENSPCIKEINTNANTHVHKETSTESQTHRDYLRRVRFLTSSLYFSISHDSYRKKHVIKTQAMDSWFCRRRGQALPREWEMRPCHAPFPRWQSWVGKFQRLHCGALCFSTEVKVFWRLPAAGLRRRAGDQTPSSVLEAEADQRGVCVDWSTRKCQPGGHGQLLFDGDQ